MKQFFIIAATLFLFNSYNTAAQTRQVKTIRQTKSVHQKENDFGSSVFKALQGNSVDAWMALYPTNEEYKGILQAGLAAKAEGLTQQVIDDIIIRREKEAAAAYTTQFVQYQKLADSVGVIWKEAVFEKFDFSPVYPEPVKLKYLSATIWFRCKKKHFAIDGIQAVEIASGYKLQRLESITPVDED